MGPSENTVLKFPEGFLWGAASSAYQIEGAYDEGGRGESMWDRFSKTPGKTFNGDTGDVACDHYHRMKDDVRLMAEMGLKAYRFSIAWPRIVPGGVGKTNPVGLDFYDRLVDELLRHGIAPFPTLYHWDMPQALEDRGGWMNRDTAGAFADYAAVVAARLSDRVGDWITLNEPLCSAFLGYRDGIHAPGKRERPAVVNQVIHHLLLAHGMGVAAIRQNARRPCRIGLAHNPSVKIPLTAAPEDLAAAKAAWYAEDGWWFDPLFKGAYPAPALGERGGDVPRMAEGDMRTISTPIDFLGLNIYTASWVQADDPVRGPGYRQPHFPQNFPKTEMGWNILPESAYYGLAFAAERYSPPGLYIMENGCAFNDAVSLDGRVQDPARIDYLGRHLYWTHRAISEGLPVRGYFVWTLLDNFEWSYGYSKRFGLVYVDFQSQRRIPKSSASWYKRVIGDNALHPGKPEVPA